MDIALKPVVKTEEKIPEPVQNDIPKEPSKAAKTFAGKVLWLNFSLIFEMFFHST